jgi:low affinity Fe/Cu permease
MNGTWGVAVFVMAGLYSFHDDWRYLTIYLIATSMLTCVPIFFIDESPHYHITLQSDFKSAHQVLDKIADAN